VEREKTAFARQQHGKYISAAMNNHATIEEVLEATFSTSSEDITNREDLVCAVVICRVCSLVAVL
jgi:hypothetical protein